MRSRRESIDFYGVGISSYFRVFYTNADGRKGGGQDAKLYCCMHCINRFLGRERVVLVIMPFPTYKWKWITIYIEIALVVYWFIKNEITTSNQAESTEPSSNSRGPLPSLLCLVWQGHPETAVRGPLDIILQPLSHLSSQRMLRLLTQYDHPFPVSQLISLRTLQTLKQQTSTLHCLLWPRRRNETNRRKWVCACLLWTSAQWYRCNLVLPNNILQKVITIWRA